MGHAYRVEYRFYDNTAGVMKGVKVLTLHYELKFLSVAAVEDALAVVVEKNRDRLTGNSYKVFYDVTVMIEGSNKFEVKRTLPPFEVKHL